MCVATYVHMYRFHYNMTPPVDTTDGHGLGNIRSALLITAKEE